MFKYVKPPTVHSDPTDSQQEQEDLQVTEEEQVLFSNRCMNPDDDDDDASAIQPLHQMPQLVKTKNVLVNCTMGRRLLSLHEHHEENMNVYQCANQLKHSKKCTVTNST